MSSLNDSRPKIDRVLAARQKVEERIDVLRAAFDRETRWVPRGDRFFLPLVGFAVGLSLTSGRRRRGGRPRRVD
ncbi:MAG: hypothetical protein AAGC60_16565 [Acidobacteriota bacterium]